jgi:hypothetical protein
MTVTFQSRMNDEKYYIEDVEKELLPEYDYFELVEELYTKYEPKRNLALHKDFKKCRVCEEIKRVEMFYKTRANTVGRRNSCIKCDSKYYKSRIG